ncbi:triose-phosphate isomerase family protein [uncultured Enterocloster sp.]|jgi:triosephosphate isomerase|uniref:triose-phosphate isomerase family protein n=1 Tax=Enterocloster sp. TaxID=2719315 RepID=UPI0025E68D58|nr:triose-phosphate isomerase family protein [uncultured Enterocloster sp.]
MKHIFLNLKRFDVPKEYGGVNAIAPVKTWGSYIVDQTQKELMEYETENVEFAMFFPEAHVLTAAGALCEGSPVKVGCQGVFRQDTAVGGNFGAFTTSRTANAARALGCSCVLIGHCEERKDKAGILAAGGGDPSAVNKILNQEIREAVRAGLKVLYCIGETSEEQPRWQEVLRTQLEEGLKDVDKGCVTIAYEPVWAIGPGKTPPDKEYIQKIGAFVKEITGGMDVVYGGGLKQDNAAMLASVPDMDGGLIALTRFSGEIGFYPEEYLEIVKLYLTAEKA